MRMDIQKLERKTVAEMRPYESSIVAKAPCKLDQNESPYDIPKALKRRILRKLQKTPFNRYPDLSYARLRKVIARRFGVGFERVAVGSGMDDLLYCLSLAYLEKGDKAVYFTPTFGMYRICCAIMGARAVEVPLGAGFSLPESFAEECRDAKLVFLCRPNNPTGSSMPLGKVEQIVRTCPGLVCIDEAYADFARDDCLRLLKYENVVVFRTMSKAFCAAGARVGFGIADRRVISAINRVRLPWNLSALSQVTAEELLKNGGFFKKIARRLIAERLRLLSALRLMGANPVEGEANFILFGIPNAQEVFQKLLDDGVLVRRFSSPVLKEYLRVSVGTRNENDAFQRALLRATVDALFFDVDGTLIDVSKSYVEAIRLTAEKISRKKVPMKTVRAVKSLEGMNNDWDAAVEVLRRLGVKSSREQVIPIFQGIYLGKNGDGLIFRETPLAKDFLTLLRKAGIRFGIVTGRPRKEAKAALKILGLPTGTLLVAMEDAKKQKPDPDLLLLAKEKAGAKFPVYFGDSSSDIMAAKRAGMCFIAIGKGKKKDGEFARFDSPDDAVRELFL
jgi:histidinol-phosphate aminotransferase